MISLIKVNLTACTQKRERRKKMLFVVLCEANNENSLHVTSFCCNLFPVQVYCKVLSENYFAFYCNSLEICMRVFSILYRSTNAHTKRYTQRHGSLSPLFFIYELAARLPANENYVIKFNKKTHTFR